MRRFFTAGALMTAVALAAATAASAAVSPSYQLGGIALGTSFFGTGVGSAGDRATWQASNVAFGAAGATGSFTLRSNNGSTATGTFTGGTTSVMSAAPGCGRQTLSLNATLTVGGVDSTLTGTVNTFRVFFGGQCRVLLSTVTAQLAPAPVAPPPPTDGSGDL